MAIKISPWFFVAGTILFTVFGQVAMKWQLSKPEIVAQLATAAGSDKLTIYAKLLLNPVILAAYASAFLASLSWMLAIEKLSISTAYPFMALNFVLVAIAGALLFAERIQPQQVLGICVIVIGVIIVGRG